MGKKNFLTQAGQEFYHYTRQILGLLLEAESVLEDMKGLRKGVLEIAVATTANDFATRLLAAFSREHEGINYKLDVTNREALLAELVANKKDLVIMGRPPADLDLIAEPFMENPLVVIASPQHPLAEQKQIPLSAIRHETFVVREMASGTRIAMERFFAEHGATISSHMEMTSNEAIKQAVQAGLGLGIVSAHTVRLELEAKKLRILDVEYFPILRHWYVVHRKGKRLSAVAQAFKEYVLSRAKEFVATPSNNVASNRLTSR
jgi:DNA-binding transcriptional LysR family regulator